MNNSTTSSPAPRLIKSLCSCSQSDGGRGTDTNAEEKELQGAYGPKVAETALQSVSLSNKNFGGPFTGPPEYALAVSIIFTKATEQAIMPGTEPRHVLSTSILRNSLSHDNRFRQVPRSEAAPGDIIIESAGNRADGYAGIVVNHGKTVSNGSQEVQDRSSLLEIQRNHPATVIFRYMGVQADRTYPLANGNFDPNEPRLPAGQPGGGQWTSTGMGGGPGNGKAQAGMAPSTAVLSGGNQWKPGERQPRSDNYDAIGSLTDAQRNLLRQKNAEAVVIIARFGDKGETPDTPQSILNGPLKSTWGSNAGWIPGTPRWDLRRQYKGFNDEDIALMESARRNGVRALTLLAQAGKLSKAQVTALQLRGLGVLADATLNLALVLAPYESMSGLVSRGLLGAAEVTVGRGVSELASRPEKAVTDTIAPATSYAANTGDISLYIASLPTRPAVGSGPSRAFQIANAGPTEYLVSGGGTQVWADGIANRNILGVKFIGNPRSSPFVPGSSIADPIRKTILAKVESEFSRMQRIINDPSNPLSSVRIITNDPAANPYFQSLLDKYTLRGEIANP